MTAKLWEPLYSIDDRVSNFHIVDRLEKTFCHERVCESVSVVSVSSMKMMFEPVASVMDRPCRSTRFVLRHQS